MVVWEGNCQTIIVFVSTVSSMADSAVATLRHTEAAASVKIYRAKKKNYKKK